MKFQTPTGMHDVFGESMEHFDKIEKAIRKVVDFYNFSKISTPIVEDTQLFERGTGGSTDIVEKQMYTFHTKSGDSLTLRPEFTPGVVRAYIQHGMHSWPKPVRLWYMGPLFRYERPQAGRYRQFHQFGLESFGVTSPVEDVTIVLIFYKILNELGFKNLMIEVNSIGDSQCRPYFKKSLTAYLKTRQVSLCTNCRRRLKKNPLRILDCKEEKCQKVVRSAPQIIDHLCKACHAHFKTFLEFLDELEVPYSLNPYLVRGLDYYTKTVFEIFEDTEQGKIQGALAGGGRYDDLVKILGGRETPACGAAGGVERLVNLMKARSKTKQAPEETYDIFLAQVGELAKKKALKLLEEFRVAKIKVGEAIHRDSLTNQLKIAEKMKVKQVLILGQKEALDGKAIIREMKTGRQRIVAFDKAILELKKKIK